MAESKFQEPIYLGLAAGLALSIGAFSVYVLAVGSRNDYLYEQEYRRAKTIVDTNKDGIVDAIEWLAAYERAGIEPSWFRRLRPTKGELEKIIESASK